MKICIAQTRSATGDVEANIARHKSIVATASLAEADAIIFPELSLTGYEPTLARKLATHACDYRLDTLQQLSTAGNITIGAGLPLRSHHGITISMVLIQPRTTRQVYSKQYLHPDEEPFFVAGKNDTDFILNPPHLAFAICYEISVPEHTQRVFKAGATTYVASVAKLERGIDGALSTLSDIARNHKAPVLMANCIGPCDGEVGAGKSSVWNKQGELVGQLDDSREGIIIFDTRSGEAVGVPL